MKTSAEDETRGLAMVRYVGDHGLLSAYFLVKPVLSIILLNQEI